MTWQDGRVPLGARTTKGQLLVASPPLGDPNFDRSVVFMLEHNEDGAVGVVLNRPDEDLEFDGLDDWVDVLAPPAIGFVGGPVESDALIAVATATGPNDDAWSGLGPDHLGEPMLGTVDLTLHPAEVAETLHRVRIFRGYAGWGGGQLDDELDLGAWIVLPVVVDDLFTESPTQLWRSVLRRQGGRLAWIANAPDDLSAN